MKKLSDFESEKRSLTVEELLAELEAEEGGDGHYCEVEMECHRLTGVETWSVVNGQKRRYACGYRNVGTVAFCPKRRRLLIDELEEAA